MTEYAHEIAQQFVETARLTVHVTPVLKSHGLNTTKWLILHYLANTGDQRPTEIAAYLNTSIELVSMSAKPLIRRGLLIDLRKSRDKRNKHLSLTDDGVVALGSIENEIWGLENQIKQEHHA